MVGKKYCKPSLRCISLGDEYLLCASATDQSSTEIGIDHTEGAWSADANEERHHSSIWDD